MKKLKSYKNYKDSGVDWIGKIPKDWNVKKIKWLFKLKEKKVSRENPNVLSLTQQGVKKRDISTNEGQLPDSYNNYYELNKGDIVMNPMDLLSGFVAKSDYNGIISPAYYILNGNRSVYQGYYEYYFQKHYWEEIFFNHGEGVSVEHRWVLKKRILRNFSIIHPPKKQQKEIADFLDKKTEKIDLVVEKNNRQIEKLKEYKKSLISKVVTKGLDPDAEMKDSGVDWIGKIPKNWQVLNIDNLGNFSASGIDKKNRKKDKLVNMVNYTDVYGNKKREIHDNQNYMKTTAPFKKTKIHKLEKGDVLFTPSSETVDEIGESAVVMEKMNNTVYSYHLIRLRLNENINLSFRKYLFYNNFVLQEFSSRAQGTIRKTLNRYDFRKTKIILPPKNQQKEIAEFLDEKTNKIDKAINKLQNKNKLLKEYKKSLISYTVTGKIKVS